MMLYVKHSAQMCNRLWALTPALAYALHKRKRLYVLFAKKDYIDCFPNLKTSKYIKFLFSHNSSSPLSLEWRLALISEKYNLEVDGDLRDIIDVGGLSFIDGWQHSSDYSYITEQRVEIVKLFEPDTFVVNRVKGYFKDYKGITVGLHIRRGDYKDYLGGKYFYPDDVYLKIIDRLRTQIVREGKNVRFIICSNDSFAIPTTYSDVFSIRESNGITDLYALSCSDYIIGPPSSYSQWASFYGNVPLYVLLNAEVEVDIDDFSRIVTFNRFENGRQLFLNEDKQEYYFV